MVEVSGAARWGVNTGRPLALSALGEAGRPGGEHVWSRPFAQSSFLCKSGASTGHTTLRMEVLGARPSFFPRRGGASPGSASLLAASNAALSRRWDGRGNELFACKRRSRAVVAIQVVQVVSGPRQSWPP